MSEANPWRRLETREVYRNPWIRVREDQVIRPDGAPGIYGVVESKVATGVVVLTPEGDTYLVGQYRYPVEEYSWEIVEGGADDGEDPLTAAKRELREEAGLIARSWRPLGAELHLSNCFSAERGVLFLAEELEVTTAEPEGTEILQLRRLPFREAIAMVDRGEIKDAMSVIGLLRAERLLKDR